MVLWANQTAYHLHVMSHATCGLHVDMSSTDPYFTPTNYPSVSGSRHPFPAAYGIYIPSDPL
jgi:hypothetical protein